MRPYEIQTNIFSKAVIYCQSYGHIIYNSAILINVNFLISVFSRLVISA